MSTFKKCKVELLTTNQRAIKGTIMECVKLPPMYLPGSDKPIGALTLNGNPNVKKSNDYWITKALYIKSDDEIKGVDYFINKNKLYQCKWVEKNTIVSTEQDISDSMGISFYSFDKKDCKKVIATDDESLSDQVFYYPDGAVIGGDLSGYKIIPRPSESFIKKYFQEYNKSNVITDVLVEYEEEIHNNPTGKWDQLKVNPKDNTITIKKLKELKNRDEVIEILKSYAHFLGQRDGQHLSTVAPLEKWVEENL